MAEYFWVDGSGDFDDPNHWATNFNENTDPPTPEPPSGPPGSAGDVAVIGNFGSANVSASDLDLDDWFLEEGNGELNADSLTIEEGGTLTVAEGGTVAVAGSAIVGDAGGGSSILTVLGTFSASTITVDDLGSVSVAGNQPATLTAGALTIGSAGKGTLTEGESVGPSELASVTVNGALVLGSLAGSKGSLSLLNSGDSLTAQELTVGDAGSGTFNVMSGAQATVDFELLLGNGATGTGMLTVTGTGAKLTTKSSVVIGGDGAATATVSNGASFDASLSQVSVDGNNLANNGNQVINSLQINGAGSTMETGGLNVDQSSAVTNFNAAQVQVNGGSLTVDGTLNLGPQVAGYLEVSDEGTLIANGDVHIGGMGTTGDFFASTSDGSGSLSVLSGSTFEWDGSLTIGGSPQPSAPSSLVIEGGSIAAALENAGEIDVGPNASIDVDGVNSKLSLQKLVLLNSDTKNDNVGTANNGIIVVGGGGTSPSPNTILITSNGVVTGSGVLTTGTIVDNGKIEATLGTGIAANTSAASLDLDSNLTGSGSVLIDSGMRLELGQSDSDTTITFNGPAATLEFAQPTDFNATITGLQVGDSIQLDGTIVSSAFLDPVFHVLTVTNNAGVTLTYSVIGSFSLDQFAISNSGGNAVLTLEPLLKATLSTLVWRLGDPALAEWQMNGSSIASSAVPTYQGAQISPDSSWSVAGIGDFDGSGNADMLWQQSSTGALAMWLMNGATITSSAAPTFQGSAVSPDSSWSVAGFGDFNGAGNDDILWRQTSTGSLVDWSMNGSTITSSANLTSQGNTVTPGSSWSIAGIGDFNGDGDADILWRQSSTGSLALWEMNGAAIASSAALTAQGAVVSPDSSWSVAGIADFNGDGDADILWRQGTTGALAVWLMNGATVSSSANVTTSGGAAVTPDSTWNILEIGDFNGSGNADIVWQQSTTGTLVDWAMNGSQIVSSQTITSQGTPVAPPNGWQVQEKPTDFA